jgi:hypothetical protein
MSRDSDLQELRDQRNEDRKEKLLRLILEQLQDIAHVLRMEGNRATFATLIFTDSKGKITMPLTLVVGKTATARLHEFVAQGGPELAPIGPVSYTSSDVTIATVAPDPANALQAIVTAIAPGAATITGTDAGNALTAFDTVSDTPVVATFASLGLTAI